MTAGGDEPLPPRAVPVIDAEARIPALPDADPAHRLQEMDAEGIDQAVLYPSAARGSNDLTATFCATAPRRLFGAAALALSDPAAARRQLRRAVTDLGLIAAFAESGPLLSRALSDHAFDVVWEAAVDLAVPLCTPAGPALLASGLLDRHPGLRVLLLGGGRDGTVLGAREQRSRQCAVTCEPAGGLLSAAVAAVGPGRVLWGSAGPQRDAPLSGVGNAVRAAVAPCRTAEQVHLLGLDARRFYRLPSRHTGLRALLDDYFTAVTAQEIDLVRALFTPDAVFESGDIVLRGREAICGYYQSKTFTYADFRPDARAVVFDGTTIHVDIDVHIGGTENAVHDVFETDGQRITALRVSGFEEALGVARR